MKSILLILAINLLLVAKPYEIVTVNATCKKETKEKYIPSKIFFKHFSEEDWKALHSDIKIKFTYNPWLFNATITNISTGAILFLADNQTGSVSVSRNENHQFNYSDKDGVNFVFYPGRTDGKTMLYFSLDDFTQSYKCSDAKFQVETIK